MSTTQHRPRRGLLHGREEQVFADGATLALRSAQHSRTAPSHGTSPPSAARSRRCPRVNSKTFPGNMNGARRRSARGSSIPFMWPRTSSATRKVRYKGLTKNRVQWQVLFALANLYLLRKPLLAQ